MSQLLGSQRRELLVKWIERTGSVSALEAATALGASVRTIQRDIHELSTTGRLARVHGGAVGVGRRDPVRAQLRLGILVPTRGYCFDAVLAGAEQAAAASGCTLVEADYDYTDELAAARYARITSLKLDGLLVTPHLPAATWGQLCHTDVPVVLIERPWELDWVRDLDPATSVAAARSPVDHVFTDHQAGAVLGLDHLAALEHRTIHCLIRDTPTAPALLRTTSAYAETIAPTRGMTLGITRLGRSSDQHGVLTSALEELFHHQKPTALFVHTDEDAVAAQEFLRARDVDVPGDVSILSYDDGLPSNPAGGLSAIAPDRIALGRRAVEMIVDRLSSRGQHNHEVHPPTKLAIVPRLHQRATTTVRRAA
ncbi:substrate-binding domain-containing protein [Kribbella kalugense]|uniref:DNA-binding LacI/PurR family transcriptional regulator n=1 Tax=Kribbella kalugense TaxID=2512221 RepID=A0A4R7ZFY0_9ACTN|nr:substrate-binding domain-containing protein [Kribbella kalugense]TDW15158.1 DNA-binding LacI/PurR family transcriptional regulator [Kribbella kalugense]